MKKIIEKVLGNTTKISSWIIIIAIVIVLLFCLFGCRSAKPIYHEEIKHDTIINTIYKDRLVYDSIYKYDSIFVQIKGDTIYIEKDRYLYKYLYKYDTIAITDTIIKYDTKTEIKEVEVKKKSSPIVRLIVVLSAFLLGAVVVWRLKFKNNN